MYSIRIPRRVTASDRGATMVEYAFLLLAVALVVVTAAYFLGDRTSVPFSSVSNDLLTN